MAAAEFNYCRPHPKGYLTLCGDRLLDNLWVGSVAGEGNCTWCTMVAATMAERALWESSQR